MGRRFSRLEWAVKVLEKAGAMPATGPFAEYKKYDSGEKVVTYTREPDSKPGGVRYVGIEAFGFMDENAAKVRIRLSQRAFTAKSNTNIIPATAAAALGWVATITENYVRRYGFSPAKAVIFKPAASQTDTVKKSKITELDYNPREGKSYTLPFGRINTTAGEAERASAIAGALAAVNDAPPSVSFLPERIRL